MCIETNIRTAEAYMKKGLHSTALDYIERVREQLYHMPCDEKKKIEHKYQHFITKYIRPEGIDGCSEITE